MRVISIALIALFSCNTASADPVLDDLAFLEGHWRSAGSPTSSFEEIWSAAEGGVMTGMARGLSKGNVSVLEYLVIAEDDVGVVMRFKHYNPDFTTWEEDGPVTLRLTALEGSDATFSATPPSETVKSIRYFIGDDGSLRSEVSTDDGTARNSFTLVFEKQP